MADQLVEPYKPYQKKVDAVEELSISPELIKAQIKFSIRRVKEQYEKRSLINSLTLYDQTFNDPLFEPKYKIYLDFIEKVPLYLFAPTFNYILQKLTALPPLHRNERRNKQVSGLYFVKYYEETLGKVQHCDILTYIAYQQHPESSKEYILQIIDEIKKNPTKIKEIARKIYGFDMIVFIVYDGHPFLFPIERVNHKYKIKSYTMNEFDLRSIEIHKDTTHKEPEEEITFVQADTTPNETIQNETIQKYKITSLLI